MTIFSIDAIRKLDPDGKTAEVVAAKFRELGGGWSNWKPEFRSLFVRALVFGEDQLEMRVFDMRTCAKKDGLERVRVALRGLRRKCEAQTPDD